MGTAFAVYGVNAANLWNSFRPTIQFRPKDGRLRRMNRRGAYATRVRPSYGDTPFSFSVQAKVGGFLKSTREWFGGEDAFRVLRATLPRLNAFGGTDRVIRSAVSEIDRHPHARGFLGQVARQGEDHRYRGRPGYILKLPKPTRLALEMALHEEDERRALEGELWRLEQAWREAEEIAGIADDLLLPEGTSGFLDRHSESGDGFPNPPGAPGRDS